MIHNSKSRGSSKLFKGSTPEVTDRTIVTYSEDGITKTAVFKGQGCRDRASLKATNLRLAGIEVLSITGGYS